MGSAQGKGDRAGPPSGEEGKQSTLNKEGGNMEQEEERRMGQV